MVVFVGTGKLVVEVIVQPVSLLLLLIGCSGDTHKKRRLRIIAWGGCALFAALEILLPMLLLAFEGVLPHAALLIVSLLMLHNERKRADHHRGGSYVYLGKVVAAAGMANFMISYITFLNGMLTFIVALQSILLPLIIGMKISLPLIDTMGNSFFFKTQYAPNLLDRSFPQIRVLVPPTDVAVVYACTGMREILVLLFAVAFTKAERQQKKKAFWLAASIVYVANILRTTW